MGEQITEVAECDWCRRMIAWGMKFEEGRLVDTGLIDKMVCLEGSEIKKCLICGKTYHSHAVVDGEIVERSTHQATLKETNECPHCLMEQRFKKYIMPLFNRKMRKLGESVMKTSRKEENEVVYGVVHDNLKFGVYDKCIDRVFELLPTLMWRDPSQEIKSLCDIGRNMKWASGDAMREVAKSLVIDGEYEWVVKLRKGEWRWVRQKRLRMKVEGEPAKLALTRCPERDSLSPDEDDKAREECLSQCRERYRTEVAKDDQELLELIINGELSQRDAAKKIRKSECQVSRDMQRLEKQFPGLKGRHRART